MPKDSADWFGKPPPDLSLMARERGADYIYSFLKGFYADKTRPWGVNNLYLAERRDAACAVRAAGLAEAGIQK